MRKVGSLLPRILLSILPCLAIFLSGANLGETADFQHRIIKKVERKKKKVYRPPHLKKRIAVARLGDDAPLAESPFGRLDSNSGKIRATDKNLSEEARQLEELNTQITEMLTTALFRSKNFLVVERKGINQILRERKFQESGKVWRRNRGEGEIFGIQYVLAGGFAANRQSLSGPSWANQAYIQEITIYGDPSRDFPGAESAGRKTIKKRIKIVPPLVFHVRVYEIDTGKVVFAGSVPGNKPDVMVALSVGQIAKTLKADQWRGNVTNVLRDKIYINAGTNSNVYVGQRFIVQNPVEQVRDQGSGNVLGYLTTDIAEIEVTRVFDAYSEAKIVQNLTEGESLSKGNWVIEPPPK